MQPPSVVISFLEDGNVKKTTFLDQKPPGVFFPLRVEEYDETLYYYDEQRHTRVLTFPSSMTGVPIFFESFVGCSNLHCNICIPRFHWDQLHPWLDPDSVVPYCCEAHVCVFERIQFSFAGKVADVSNFQRDAPIGDILACLSSEWKAYNLRLKDFDVEFVDGGRYELDGEISLRVSLRKETIEKFFALVRPAVAAMLADPDNAVSKVVFVEADLSGDVMRFPGYSMVREPREREADAIREKEIIRKSLRNVFYLDGCAELFSTHESLRELRTSYFDWVREKLDTPLPNVADKDYVKGELMSDTVLPTPTRVRLLAPGTETMEEFFKRVLDESNVCDNRATQNIAKGEALYESGKARDFRGWMTPFYYNMSNRLTIRDAIRDVTINRYFEDQHGAFPEAFPIDEKEFNLFQRWLAKKEGAPAPKKRGRPPKKRGRQEEPQASEPLQASEAPQAPEVPEAPQASEVPPPLQASEAPPPPQALEAPPPLQASEAPEPPSKKNRFNDDVQFDTYDEFEFGGLMEMDEFNLADAPTIYEGSPSQYCDLCNEFTLDCTCARVRICPLCQFPIGSRECPDGNCTAGKWQPSVIVAPPQASLPPPLLPAPVVAPQASAPPPPQAPVCSVKNCSVCRMNPLQ